MQSFLIQFSLAILFVNTVYSQVIKCPVSPLIADFDKLKVKLIILYRSLYILNVNRTFLNKKVYWQVVRNRKELARF